MKILLLGILLLGISRCGQNQFCGDSNTQNGYPSLNGKVDDNGFIVGIELASTVAQKLGYDFRPQFKINYSTEDTLVLNITKIPDENTAKKISCIVSENEIVKNTKVVYVKFNWKENSKFIKF